MKAQTGIAALLIVGGALFYQPASAQTTSGDQNGKSTSQDTTNKQNATQSQGNSAGGTSAWPQATGTTGAITPESQTPATGQDGKQMRNKSTGSDNPAVTDTTAQMGKKKKQPKNRKKSGSGDE